MSEIKKCRVCGKEYEACRSAEKQDGYFHWRAVACSPECGAIYLKRVLESRKKPAAKEQPAKAADVPKENKNTGKNAHIEKKSK